LEILAPAVSRSLKDLINVAASRFAITRDAPISIGVAVEIAIVSVLREVIVQGVLETEWQQILAVCLFLTTMALLMVVRVWLPPTVAWVDPEAQVSARLRQSHEHIGRHTAAKSAPGGEAPQWSPVGGAGRGGRGLGA
jgi:hypothetical protein